MGVAPAAASPFVSHQLLQRAELTGVVCAAFADTIP